MFVISNDENFPQTILALQYVLVNNGSYYMTACHNSI